MQEDFIDRAAITRLLLNNGIDANRHHQESILWDDRYYFFDLLDWGKVFKDILWNLPDYSKKFDCDSFALLVAARVQEKYKVNGCGIAIGDSPWGYHAWNIFAAMAPVNDWFNTFELFYLEPQNGLVYELGEDSGYKAHYVVWG